MGKRDDMKSRTTREFDSARLAALTKAKVSEVEVQQIAAAAEGADGGGEISLGRTATLDDPMTTGLLAEVARRSQTAEFDEELIKEVLTKIGSGETNHPHTRRRTAK
ncbi:MAG TPA: hypothetical protein VIV40_13745 [Kofleriaceae bacterium]